MCVNCDDAAKRDPKLQPYADAYHGTPGVSVKVFKYCPKSLSGTHPGPTRIEVSTTMHPEESWAPWMGCPVCGDGDIVTILMPKIFNAETNGAKL